MAAPQWSGGKCKDIQKAKAFFRHNDKDRRMEANHTNLHIDKRKTKNNFTYFGLSYKELCDKFDEKLASVDTGRESSGKNARVILQSVILYPPAGLPKSKERDWFMSAGKVIESKFGDNLLEIQFDMDEEHEYIDPETKTKKMSRNHGHVRLFPAVDGKLNAKQFSNRGTMVELNEALDDMSISLYGVPMIDGTKRKGGKTVESLKSASLQAEIDALEAEKKRVFEMREQARRDVYAMQLQLESVRRERDETARERDAAKRELADVKKRCISERKMCETLSDARERVCNALQDDLGALAVKDTMSSATALLDALGASVRVVRPAEAKAVVPVRSALASQIIGIAESERKSGPALWDGPTR